jgi:hypothetical protein
MIRRRTFLKSAMAAGTGALFTTSAARAAEAPPETTGDHDPGRDARLRRPRSPQGRALRGAHRRRIHRAPGGGKIDAIITAPPSAQELRARKIGHVVVTTAVDRPWSQYFCCMLVGNKDFVRKHPVATKRVLRAIFKADQLCAQEPERVARSIVDRGFTKHYDYALQGLKDVPYGKARQYDPEDMVRFYSLRLREAGLIKGTPQKIIAEGTDWRFLNELKKELKG